MKNLIFLILSYLKPKMSTISLSKSLRTPKVALDPGNVADTFRIFVSNPTCDIRDYRMDEYGRPSSIYGGLQVEGAGNGNSGGAPGCFSPEYRIMWENALRPQYAEYLNVPQGLMMTHSEFENQPHYDMLGVNRDRYGAFNVDGTYKRTAYPSHAQNPNSDKQWLEQQEWYGLQMLNQFDSRLWLNSADTQSGF